MSNQPPPPWGDQNGPGGYGGPPQPGGYGGPPPGAAPPGGYGGPPPGAAPPGGYGAPPGAPPPGGGYGGPPGLGGPGGYGGPPQSSKTPLIIGIIAAVLLIGGGIGAYFVFSGDDGDVAVATSPSPTEPEEDEPTEEPTEEDEPTAEPTDEDEPTAEPTDPPTAEPIPTETTPALPPQPAPPAPAPPAGGGQEMAMNEGLVGQITAEQPAQDFFFDGFAGEEVVLTMIAIDDTLDPLLRLYGPDGQLLDENDDDFDLEAATDSRIQITLPADGEYRVEATSFANTTGSFELTLSFPSVLTASDTLSDAVPEIGYDYTGVAGQTIVIQMRGLDDAVDPLVYVEDASGTEIGRDDDSGAAPLDARLEIVLPADGTYTIVAAAFSERFGPFELTVTEL